MRPFLSGSFGISIVSDGMFLDDAVGFGGQLLGGFEVRVNAGLRIGLALQCSYSRRHVDQPSQGSTRPIEAGHAAGLLTFTYDTRARAR